MIDKKIYKPLVSIIVPVYNDANNIKRTLLRLLNQSYRNVEIVVVDDGSTDQTIEVVESVAQDNKIIFNKQSHAGVAAARNRGLNIMRGEFVTFVDSDDFVSLEYISILMSPFLRKSQNIAVSIGKFKTVKEIQDDFFDHRKVIERNPDQALTQLLMQEDNTDVSLSAKIYRASVIEGLHLSNGIVFEDLEYNVRLFSKLNPKSIVAFVDACVFEYVQRANSIMHRGFTNEEMSILQVVDTTLMVTQRSTYIVRQALNNKLISTLAGVYARAIIDNAALDKQRALYRRLVRLGHNIQFKGPLSMKSIIIAAVLKFGPFISKRVLCTAYKITKKI